MQNTDFANPTYQLTNQQRKDMKLRYYTTDVHKAAFALPAFLVDALEGAWHSSYLQRTHLMYATCLLGNQKYYIHITHYITCCPLSQIKQLFHLLNTVLVKPNLQHMCNDVLLYSDAMRNYIWKTLENTKSNISVKLLNVSVMLLLSRIPVFGFGYISFSFFLTYSNKIKINYFFNQ